MSDHTDASQYRPWEDADAGLEQELRDLLAELGVHVNERRSLSPEEQMRSEEAGEQALARILDKRPRREGFAERSRRSIHRLLRWWGTGVVSACALTLRSARSWRRA